MCIFSEGIYLLESYQIIRIGISGSIEGNVDVPTQPVSLANVIKVGFSKIRPPHSKFVTKIFQSSDEQCKKRI